MIAFVKSELWRKRLGVLNMLALLVILFALRPSTLPVVLIAAGIAEIYFASMPLAPLFPGTAWSDPEFEALNPCPLGIPIQKMLSLSVTGLIIAAVVASLC